MFGLPAGGVGGVGQCAAGVDCVLGLDVVCGFFMSEIPAKNLLYHCLLNCLANCFAKFCPDFKGFAQAQSKLNSSPQPGL
jgi:hypothetical protein